MTTPSENLSITKQQILEILKLNPFQIKFIDVRNDEEYKANHIQGALHISLNELSTIGKIFDPQDHLITVCGKGGGRSMQGAEILRSLSYKNVFWLEGGTFGWL